MTEKFTARRLSVLAYAQGFTWWHYRAERTADTLNPEFFAAFSDQMSPGDRITVSCPEDAAELSLSAGGKTKAMLAGFSTIRVRIEVPADVPETEA